MHSRKGKLSVHATIDTQTQGFKFYSCSFFEKEDIMIRKFKEEVFYTKIENMFGQTEANFPVPQWVIKFL